MPSIHALNEYQMYSTGPTCIDQLVLLPVLACGLYPPYRLRTTRSLPIPTPHAPSISALYRRGSTILPPPVIRTSWRCCRVMRCLTSWLRRTSRKARRHTTRLYCLQTRPYCGCRGARVAARCSQSAPEVAVPIFMEHILRMKVCCRFEVE